MPIWRRLSVDTTRYIGITYGLLHMDPGLYVMQLLHKNFIYGYWRESYIRILHTDYSYVKICIQYLPIMYACDGGKVT